MILRSQQKTSDVGRSQADESDRTAKGSNDGREETRNHQQGNAQAPDVEA